jgi:hypothetical protein
MKTPEEIMKEMHWTYDADPGRYSLFISLIKPAMENYAAQFKILNKHEYMKLKIFDTNREELNIGDIVQVQEKRNCGLTFYTRVQIINGQLYPFNRFAYDRVFKVDEVPSDCKHCQANEKENMPEYWMRNEVEVKLVEEGRLEKWRMDSVFFDRNSFYEVAV